LAAAAAACAGPKPPFDPKEADRARLVVGRLVDANDRLDMPAVLACFTPEGSLVTAEGSTAVGREEIERYHAELFRDYDPRLLWRSERATARGDLAVDHGTIRGELVSRKGAENRAVNVRYLAILKRAGDDWRISVLTWDPAEPAR
jgi:uncharacterized protein (TIGR02246 family)